MSLKSNITTAFVVIHVSQAFLKSVMDSDSDFARDAQKKMFGAIPHDRLLRYERLVADELRRRRSS